MKSIIIGIIVLWGVFNIANVYAADAPDKAGDPLVPCATKANPDMCRICDLAEGIHNIVTLIIKLLLVTGTVVIVVAGVTCIVSTGNPSMTTMAKSAMTNALVGTIIVLSAFMIITFLINTIFNAGSKVEEGGLKGFVNGAWTFECPE